VESVVAPPWVRPGAKCDPLRRAAASIFRHNLARMTRKGKVGVGASDGKQPSTIVLLSELQSAVSLVKVEARPETADREITCRECKASFPAREGKFVFKYFMLRKAARLHKSRRV
jgi:hypothetical protein